MERRAFLAGGLLAPALLRPPAAAGAPLPQRVLGRTGLAVSALGFGCTDVRDPAVYRRAVDLGVTCFLLNHDAKRQNPEAAAALLPFRGRIVVGCLTNVRGSAEAMRQELDAFLAMSGFGHVDLWYFVTPTPALRGTFVEAFSEARRAGKARFAAITTHDPKNHLEALVAPESPIDAVMLVHNFTTSPEVSSQVDRLHAAGVAITPMKPMAGNFTTEKTGEADAQHAAALRWLVADTRVGCVPTVMTSLLQLEANAAAVGAPFSREDEAVLRAWTPRVSERFCRDCGTCAGSCPSGVHVPGLVRAAMYAEGYADLDRARREVRAIPASRRRPACTACPECTVRCPSGVFVRARIERALALA
jgi:aryl-alcohol dehydrogenase-like predicted oxidoreductase